MGPSVIGNENDEPAVVGGLAASRVENEDTEECDVEEETVLMVEESVGAIGWWKF